MKFSITLDGSTQLSLKSFWDLVIRRIQNLMFYNSFDIIDELFVCLHQLYDLLFVLHARFNKGHTFKGLLALVDEGTHSVPRLVEITRGFFDQVPQFVGLLILVSSKLPLQSMKGTLAVSLEAESYYPFESTDVKSAC